MLASLHASAILVLSIITPSISSPLPLPTISASSSDVSNSVSNGVDDGVSNSTHAGANPLCSRFTCCVANFMAAPCCYMARNPECCECWERRGNRSRDPVVVIAPQEGPRGHSAVVLRTSNTNFPASRIGGNGVDQTEDDSGPFGFLSWLVQAAKNRYNGHRTGPETARDNSGPTRASTRADDIGDALVSSSSFSEPKHEALVMPHAPTGEFEARSNGQQNTEVKLDVNAATLANVLPASVENLPSMMKADASEQVTTIVSFNPLETPKADESSEPVAVIEAKPLAPEDDPIALLNLTLDKTEPDVTRPDGLEESESQPERSDVEGGDAEPGSESAPLPEPAPAGDELQRTEADEGETKTNTAPNDDVPFVVTSEVASDTGKPEEVAPITEEEKPSETEAVVPEVPATVKEETLDEVLAQFLPKEQPQDEASLAVADKRDELIINDDIQQEAPFSSLEVIEDASPLPVEQLFKEHKFTELKVEKIPAKAENKPSDEAQNPDQKQALVKDEEKEVGTEEGREVENEEVKKAIVTNEIPKLTSETVEEARTDKTEVETAAVESEAQAEPEPSSDVETEPRAEPEPSSDVETEPRAEPEPSSAVETEPRAEPEPSSAVETEPRAEPEPSSAVVSEPRAEPEPSQETKSEPQAEPEPTSDIGSEPKAEPEPSSNVENKEVPAKDEKETAKDPFEAEKSTNEAGNKKTESMPDQHPSSNAEAAAPEPANEDKPEKRDETSETKEKPQAETVPKDDKKEMVVEKMANTTDKAAESDVKKVAQMSDIAGEKKNDEAPLDDGKKDVTSGNVSSSPEKAPQPEMPENAGSEKTSDSVVDVSKSADEVEEKSENMTDDEKTDSTAATEATTTASTTISTTSEATTSPSSTTTAEISTTTPRVTSTTEGLKAVPVAGIVTRRSSSYDQYRRAPSFWVVIDKRRSKKQP